MASAAGSLKITLGGTAVVCCVHDRVKREVTTEEQVMKLLNYVGFQLKKGVHHMFTCSCCENLFVDEGTEPRFCSDCRVTPIHALGGPLPEPKGVVG